MSPLKRENHFGDLGAYRRIILKTMLNKWGVMLCICFTCPRIGHIGRKSNAYIFSIKGGKFLDQLSDY
jgi:hypothetical protein